jgi:uncharacterized membrane protein YhhN
VHTEHVPKLGWFDRWFCSPSNHRVHHAVNDRYLDRNYGGILVVWDRLFGSFQEEDEKCVYGTRSPLRSWDPLWANAEVYWSLAQDSWHARRWHDKLRVWFKPPGWRPADVAARFPRAPFRVDALEKYQPPMAGPVAVLGAVQFALLLGGVALFLWHADAMPPWRAGVWLTALAAGLWAVGALMQGRITIAELLMVDAAALSTATAAEGWMALHQVFKPLAMVLAIAFVFARAGGTARLRIDPWLVGALGLCLLGDLLLMRPGLFIPGLASFLLAHLCYIALLRRGVGLLPRRGPLLATLGLAAVLYAALFPSLDEGLRVAVAAYAVVIAVMAAQAIGRAQVLGDPASRGLAAGAVIFMASDALLAVDRFALPLPVAPFWVLATYYLAQGLIVHHAVAASASSPPEPPPVQARPVPSGVG